MTLLEKVKANLILEHDEDDELIESFLAASITYSESFQHIGIGFYEEEPMSPTTEQAVIMLASHFYESRDGSTGGYFGDNVAASKQVWETVHLLLRMGRDYKF